MVSLIFHENRKLYCWTVSSPSRVRTQEITNRNQTKLEILILTDIIFVWIQSFGHQTDGCHWYNFSQHSEILFNPELFSIENSFQSEIFFHQKFFSITNSFPSEGIDLTTYSVEGYNSAFAGIFNARNINLIIVLIWLM